MTSYYRPSSNTGSRRETFVLGSSYIELHCEATPTGYDVFDVCTIGGHAPIPTLPLVDGLTGKMLIGQYLAYEYYACYKLTTDIDMVRLLDVHGYPESKIRTLLDLCRSPIDSIDFALELAEFS